MSISPSDGRALLAIGETMAMVAPMAAERLADASAFRVDAGGAESNVAAHVVAGSGTPRAGSAASATTPSDTGSPVSCASAESTSLPSSSTRRIPRASTSRIRVTACSYYRTGSAASRLSPADADPRRTSPESTSFTSRASRRRSRRPRPQFLDAVFELAREAGVRVSFDVNHRPALWGAATAAGPLAAARAPRRHRVRRARRGRGAVVDDGCRRACAHSSPKSPNSSSRTASSARRRSWARTRSFEPALAVEVVEAVGAGDAFAGGYLAALLEGAPVAERLRAGHDRAALDLRTTSDYVEGKIGS